MNYVPGPLSFIPLAQTMLRYSLDTHCPGFWFCPVSLGFQGLCRLGLWSYYWKCILQSRRFNTLALLEPQRLIRCPHVHISKHRRRGDILSLGNLFEWKKVRTNKNSNIFPCSFFLCFLLKMRKICHIFLPHPILICSNYPHAWKAAQSLKIHLGKNIQMYLDRWLYIAVLLGTSIINILGWCSF